MSRKRSQRSPEKYEELILNYLKQFPSGLTITDISDGIKVSRITVNKYVLVLEAKEKLFSRSIGAYKLYFSSERSYVPKRTSMAFYQGLLSGLVTEISEVKEETFKKIGLNMDKFITFPVGSQFPRDLTIPKKGSYKELFEYYAEIYNTMDYIVEEYADIDVKINEKGNKAIYTFKVLKVLEKYKNFAMHFYLVSGMIEKTLSKLLKKKVLCNVEKIYDNNIDLSIEILE